MNYQIKLNKRVKKIMDHLPKNDRKRIVRALEQLPHQGDIKRVQGYSEFFRLRVGQYRIIYNVDHRDLIVYVIDIGNRGQIYNRY